MLTSARDETSPYIIFTICSTFIIIVWDLVFA